MKLFSDSEARDLLARIERLILEMDDSGHQPSLKLINYSVALRMTYVPLAEQMMKPKSSAAVSRFRYK